MSRTRFKYAAPLTKRRLAADVFGNRWKLYQFQCEREGTLFYYQSGFIRASSLSNVVMRCPVCGSKRIAATGRVFNGVQEDAAVQS